jgi:hypothetical protein
LRENRSREDFIKRVEYLPTGVICGAPKLLANSTLANRRRNWLRSEEAAEHMLRTLG